MKKHWLLICFINFFVAALMGLLLRLMYVAPIENVNFQFLLHGHSHVAMLGWVYQMLFCLLVHHFVPLEVQQKPVYNRLFWMTQFAVFGMMFRFPFEGYAFLSIAFSTLHILCCYYFCWLIWNDSRPDSLQKKQLLRTALVFMIVSTFGVWFLGPAVGMFGKASAFYQIAIQFFLHFQFNGWFMFAVLALFFCQWKIEIDEKKFRVFYSLLVIATILTFALPVSWYLTNSILYWINGLGLVLQLLAFVVFVSLIKPHFYTFFNALQTIEKMVYGFALFSLALKIGIQLITFVPEMAQVSHQIRNFVIGYVHLTLLGMISSFLFGFNLQNKFLDGKSSLVNWGIKIFLLGFVLTEILLFTQGIFLFLNNGVFPMYQLNLFIASIALPAGLLLLTISIYKLKSRMT